MSFWEKFFGGSREGHSSMDPEVAARLAEAKRIEASAIEDLAMREDSEPLRHLAQTKRGEAELYESYYEDEEFAALVEESEDE